MSSAGRERQSPDKLEAFEEDDGVELHAVSDVGLYTCREAVLAVRQDPLDFPGEAVAFRRHLDDLVAPPPRVTTCCTLHCHRRALSVRYLRPPSRATHLSRKRKRRSRWAGSGAGVCGVAGSRPSGASEAGAEYLKIRLVIERCGSLLDERPLLEVLHEHGRQADAGGRGGGASLIERKSGSLVPLRLRRALLDTWGHQTAAARSTEPLAAERRRGPGAAEQLALQHTTSVARCPAALSPRCPAALPGLPGLLPPTAAAREQVRARITRGNGGMEGGHGGWREGWNHLEMQQVVIAIVTAGALRARRPRRVQEAKGAHEGAVMSSRVVCCSRRRCSSTKIANTAASQRSLPVAHTADLLLCHAIKMAGQARRVREKEAATGRLSTRSCRLSFEGRAARPEEGAGQQRKGGGERERPGLER